LQRISKSDGANDHARLAPAGGLHDERLAVTVYLESLADAPDAAWSGNNGHIASLIFASASGFRVLRRLNQQL